MVKSVKKPEIHAERSCLPEENYSSRWTRKFDSLSPIDPELLGNKGASLAEMTRLGLPVPPGFTLTTEVWQRFNQDGQLPREIWQETLEQLATLERKAGKKLGDPNNPLVVSVRSGARYSMPGMMETILNVGVTQETREGLAREIGDVAAENAYQRLQEGWGGQPPPDPYQQLREAIVAILSSWSSPRAIDYRRFTGIPHEAGTAVTIQRMVFGNIADGQSGSGVVFTRNPQTGKEEIWGEFTHGAQGIEVVSGRQATQFILKTAPWARKLGDYGKKLDRFYSGPQDVEFTVEKGKLWLLQSRTARLSPLGTVVASFTMFRDGLISQEEAFRRISQEHVRALMRPTFNQEAEEQARKNSLIAKGKIASLGQANGLLATTPEKAKELSHQGKRAILVTDYFDPNNVALVFSSKAIVTRVGGTASHMALIMQAAGVAGIVGCEGVVISPGHGLEYNGKFLKEGKEISVDATTGEVFRGWIPFDKPQKLVAKIRKFLEERQEHFGSSAWVASLYPIEAPYRREDFLQRIQTEVSQEIAKWDSPKAIETIVLNTLFPPGEIIQARIVAPDDVIGLEEAIRRVYEKEGYEAIPRSIHTRENLGKEPWTNVPQDRVRDFIYHPNYIGNPTHPEYRGLPQWKENPHLVGIIVPAEPRGKMDKDLYPMHFAFTIRCIDAQPSQVLVDISLGNPHLREIEKISPERLIEIKALLNPDAPYSVGQIVFDFGRENFNQANLDKLLQAMAGEMVPEPIIDQILGTINQRYVNEKLDKVDADTLLTKIRELSKSGLLTEEMYQFLLQERAWLITQLVADKVFRDWWHPPFALPHVMAALDQTFGLSVLEGQGRMEEDYSVPWTPKVYGAKGPQEIAIVK